MIFKFICFYRANCKTPDPQKIDDFGDNFQSQLGCARCTDENIPEWVGEEVQRKLPPKGRFYEGQEFCNWLYILFFSLVLHTEVCGNINKQEYHYQISIVAITKDDAPYLAEWIDYHRLIGVDHFYIYDNNTGEDTHQVLDAYIRQGIVSYNKWPTLQYDWGGTQHGAYTHALNECKLTSHWISFLDTDEFIVPMKYLTLSETLEREYQDKPLIYVNWRMFGTSYLSLLPPCLILPHLTKCSRRNFVDNRIGKMIVQPQFLLPNVINVHITAGVVGFTDGSGNPYPYKTHQEIWADKRYPINDQLLRINHYTFRDEWFFHTIKIPRVIYFKRSPAREYLMNARHYNVEEDLRIHDILRIRLLSELTPVPVPVPALSR